MNKKRRPTVSLAPYVLKIRQPESRKSLDVSNFGVGKDLLPFLHTFLQGLQAGAHEEAEAQQVLRVKKVSLDGRRLTGLIETGDYGSESELFDVKKRKVAHTRKATEADMLPFYFLIDVPEGLHEAILILERRGNAGIRNVFYSHLSKIFAEQNTEFQLRIGTLTDTNELSKYLKGRVETIRFIRFSIPSDISDAIGRGNKQTEGKVELVIKAKRGKALPLNGPLQKFFKGETPLAELIALDLLDYENIKMEARSGQSRRTIDLGRDRSIRAYHDVTNEIELDEETGNPVFDSIDELASEHLENLRSRMYKLDGHE